MTAFLFIPSIVDARPVRRVDFANIASLFVDAEEHVAQTSTLQSRAIRIAAFAVIVLALIGDTVVIARPSILSHGFAMAQGATIHAS